ncbi:glycine betaine transporter membrane protein [Halomicronema hongdechloris C2206]|uniref:Glycine betaine transporter membrane protein n=1 Tax=Halomicronema hongdechloris C2206 TaxID=1641165 RepID=A0A1Z3HI88_9CYAN|nr:proline/glycine betaine ABC transporter permease [Halomicronema hongdechloris]ASC69998.1 glycine betaine transporter membrane protein [Halomicronema hongdechloris C2206]
MNPLVELLNWLFLNRSTEMLPLADWIETGVGWVVDNFRWIFQLIRWPVGQVLNGIETFFQSVPPVLFIGVLVLIAWQFAGRGVAIFTLIAMLLTGAMGAWNESMTTLSLVVTAVVLCTVIGIPLGITAARSERFEQIIRPILDAMQTLPAFVYLVPVVMLFGTGKVPGVIVTFIFAVPPLIRLTNIGIRQVSKETVEAALAFGSTPRQVLWEVQVPLAMPTILAGVNQSIMLALSMVVIASLIAVEGLGQMVNRGIGRLDVGLAAVGGLGIVLMAIVLDRITQAIGHPPQDGLDWADRGLVGFIRHRFLGQQPSPARIR